MESINCIKKCEKTKCVNSHHPIVSQIKKKNL